MREGEQEGLVYHYTTKDTFFNMMKSKSIWLTDLRKMNDETEYTVGFSVIRSYVEEHYPALLEEVDKLSPENMGDEFLVLISSFSSSSDSLSMWRGYGEFGEGFSLGFDPLELQMFNLGNRYLNKGAPVIGKIQFQHVFYDKKAFLEYLEYYLYGINEQFKKDDPVHKRIAMGKLKLATKRLASLFKDESYYDEKEVRGFIEIHNGNDPYALGKRNTPYGEADYHAMEMSMDGYMPIKKIILGPRNKTSIEEMNEYLKTIEQDHVEVVKSKVPFR
ncbi:DUF2971 domain-containing protein [Providencia sp. 2.29]|uniref:DUF2971 domain-containing protein n=1 Tax=Providencia sp. 2.29 TaxID=2791982 RepID=UPI0018CBCC00|nr:DUF2971 domain-containing protein [Providencia sp. 2.29]QPN39100.1 DUF2971 domain-containing protein [Providencia sp. 2.29]